jgi:uncharacterized protein (DUF1501 family)
MRRRDALLAGPLAAVALALPSSLLAKARQSGWNPRRTLILVELAGGNDGLNTVIPFADPAYARLRPAIGIPRESVLAIDERLGLHPSLEKLVPIWRAREMAIVQGVGYANPNRSHFRSIDIWHTASGSDRTLSEGWISRLGAGGEKSPGVLADAIVLGGSPAPAAGGSLRALAMADPDRLVRQVEGGTAPAPESAGNPALDHMRRIRRDIGETAQELKAILAKTPEIAAEFPNGPLAQQLRVAARLVTAGASVPVIKLALNGFDTHANQPGTHANLLRQLGDGIAAFRRVLMDSGHWNRVLVMTYSEFGRRAAQNGSNGTDHGTAAPHFAIGAKVRSGLYGPAPDLTDLDGGDIKHAIDYRRLYVTVAERWWEIPGAAAALGGHKALPILA